MKKIGMNLLIILFYCFPFVYFSMYKDYETRSMIGYLLMIVSTSTLAFVGRWSNNKWGVFIGNIASVIVSYYFIGEMTGNERWEGYFKPLTPTQLLFLVSILNLFPQLIGVELAKKFKK